MHNGITCSKPPVIRCSSNGHISHITSVYKVIHHLMKVLKNIAGAHKLDFLYVTPFSSCNSNTNSIIWRVCVSGCIIVESACTAKGNL